MSKRPTAGSAPGGVASDGRPLVEPEDARAWRRWLRSNHATSGPIWLVYPKKGKRGRQLTYEEAVEEALCFGWIDSTLKTLDDRRNRQFFSRRKPSSTWSRSNKARVERLIADGRMTEAGMAPIEAAKANGMWTALDSVEALEIPSDLAEALDGAPGARANFGSFTASSKKGILWWIASAKRPETRRQRIEETARMAAQGRRANHPEDRA